MSRLLVCPHGHQWEVGTAAEANHSGTPAVCPVCGATAVTQNLRTEAFVPERPRPPEGTPPGPLTLPPPASVPADETTELPTVPGYEVMGVLGRGGMGVVYNAWQPELNRIVALKMVLAGAHAGSQELARFRTEAEAVGRLQHPHIVQIYGIGRHEEHPYLVLEYVDGGSLAQKLTGVPLPARRTAELVETLARAMHYAHERGIVHRDLTPGNVLLTADGQPKITDFGLAKLLVGGGAVRTQSGAIVGTPSYMAPEQAAGKTKEIGPATDVYGLGAILYELLTGRPPFRAETPLETLLQVQADEPVPPSRLQPKLPRDLGTICLKAIARAPERRYVSAGELADDLRRWRDGEPIQARPVGAWERGVNWARRRPAVAALLLASAVAVLALGGVVTGAFYNARLGELLEQTEREKHRAEGAQRQAELFQYFHHIARAQAGWHSGNLSGVEQLLDDCPVDQRGWEWHYLKRQHHADLRTLDHSDDGVMSVAYSHDGRHLASATDKTVRIWDATTGQPTLIHSGELGGVGTVAFSPDGSRLAAVLGRAQHRSRHAVQVWDATTGQEMHTLRGSGEFGLAFSPDGKRLASGSGELVTLWDLPTGQPIRTLHHPGWLRGLAFSPDGTRLASAAFDGTVRLWDVRPSQDVSPLVALLAPAPVLFGLANLALALNGVPLLTLEGHTNWVLGVAFSPDGTRLASTSFDQTVRVWNATTGQPTLILRGHTGAVWSVAFSPDGKWLASASADRTVRLWDSASGRIVRAFKGHTGLASSVAFSPDGTRLASSSADGTVKVWDVTTDPEATMLTSPSELWSMAFSPDGKWLASGSEDGIVRLWDARTGQVDFTWKVWKATPAEEKLTLSGLPSLKYYPGRVVKVTFSPDGKRLAATGGRTVKVWNATRHQEELTLPGHTDLVTSVAFSPDGTRLASCGKDGLVKIWHVALANQEPLTLPGHTDWVWSVAFSPDGTRLASCGRDGKVKVWDATTGLPLRTLEGHGPVLSVAFSPDGTRLASGSADYTLRVWDTTSEQELLTLRGHTDQVRSVAFSPDGRRLASTGGDQRVKVWDAAAGQELLSLEGHTAYVQSVAFSPDGTRLASASWDGTIRVWDARPWMVVRKE